MIDYVLLDRIEEAFKKLGSPRDVLGVMPLIIGRYVALGLPNATAEEAWIQVLPHFRTLFNEGFAFGKKNGPS
jgi:hypothetical protein